VPELYEAPSQLLNHYPARVDPPSLAEPRHIQLPKHNPSIVLALHPYDKAEVDSNYMGFIIVMERIWTQFLREYLEGFCRQQGHCSIRREVVDLEVRKELVRWASRAAVESDFPHQVEEARDASHLEYEHRLTTSNMPNDAIGTTGIPSDFSYAAKEGFGQTPSRPERPQGLSQEQADAILKDLPVEYWRFNLNIYRAAANSVKDEWANEPQEKYKWDQDNLDSRAIRQMDGAFEASAGEQYFGANKSDLEKLEDEYHVRLNKEYVKYHLAEFHERIVHFMRQLVEQQRQQ
ncbi:MAG: hypothetical protein Q9192_007495, partial [Flavoplaca navasiana]